MNQSAETVHITQGDCLAVMASMPEASVDAIVTDPPYGLGFMGKAWDALPPGEEWARACYRVLKPGGYMLAFGGTRTWHRLATAIEDADFELRDSIAWLYGSGFPKSMDISKAIDKAAGAARPRRSGGSTTCPDFPGDCGGHATANGSLGGGVMRHAAPTAAATPEAQAWEGWGTALKPAFEPIVVARKPLSERTVAANVQVNGVGGLNIDGCRIEGQTYDRATPPVPRASTDDWRMKPGTGAPNTAGRFPANVVMDESQAAALNDQTGVLTSGYMKPETDRAVRQGDAYGTFSARTGTATYADSGGASRFFYVAKAPTKERPKIEGLGHPTVKPLTLMRWLVRLVTPPGGKVLDPFAGSGTTLEAALLEGFNPLGIELCEEYLPLIRTRLARALDSDSDLFGGVA